MHTRRCCKRAIDPALLALLVAGCAGAPQRGPAVDAPVAVEQPASGPAATVDAATLLRRVREQVGAPYRYGGASPEGFDCSGLVRYAYEGIGVELPRTVDEQQRATEPVDIATLEPGDLVFFRLPDAHVGIYLGDREFIHAPGSGRRVATARLDEPWFILAFAGAGRVPLER